MLLSTSTELVKRASVEELVGHRNRAIEAYKHALEMLASAGQAFARATEGKGRHGSSLPYDHSPRSTDMKLFTKALDRDVWRRLVVMTRLVDLMDAARRKAFDKQLEDNPPEVTVGNVIATISDLMGKQGDVFRDSIVATFEALPREYKSNDGFKYGKRIIFSYALSTEYGAWSFRGYGYTEERIRDLERIMFVLDGKPPPKYPGGVIGAVSTAASQTRTGFTTSTEYFECKGFKCGTLHMKPLRRDLLDKANRILADHYGHQLPRPQKAA